MASTQFFATRVDLIEALTDIEKQINIKYYSTADSYTNDIKCYLSCSQLPSLGIADKETGTVCSGYLVMPESAEIIVYDAISYDGRRRHVVDQMYNVDSIVFVPAGVLYSGVLIQGSFGTASDSVMAKKVYRLFRSAFQKHFVQHRGIFIGKEAHRMWIDGCRLTAALQSPSEFDLK